VSWISQFFMAILSTRIAILDALFVTIALFTETTILMMEPGKLQARISAIALMRLLALFILKVNTSAVCAF